MKEFVCNEVSCVQDSILLKLEIIGVYLLSILSTAEEHLFQGTYFDGYFHCLLLHDYSLWAHLFLVSLISLKWNSCHWNGILVLKKYSSKTMFKGYETVAMTNKKFCVIVIKWAFFNYRFRRSQNLMCGSILWT